MYSRLNIGLSVLLILLFISTSSAATCSASQSGSTIYSGNCSNITEVNNTINNASALQNQGNGVWFLNANLEFNGGNNFYINNSDTTWIKVNSTGSTYFYIQIPSGAGTTVYIDNGTASASLDGSTCTNCINITSWNVTTNSVETRTWDTRTTARSYFIVKSGNVIANYVNASFLGYDVGPDVPGWKCYGCSKFVVNNSVMINNEFGVEAHDALDSIFYNNNIYDSLEAGIVVKHTSLDVSSQPTEYGHSEILNNTASFNGKNSADAVIIIVNSNNTTSRDNIATNGGGRGSGIKLDTVNHVRVYNIVINQTNDSNIDPGIYGATANDDIYFDGGIVSHMGAGRGFDLSGGLKNITFEGIDISSGIAQRIARYTNVSFKNSTFTSKNAGAAGVLFGGTSETGYVYNVTIRVPGDLGLQINGVGVKNLTVEDSLISGGTGSRIDIVGENLTNKIINTSYSTVTTSSGGKLNYYYNTSFSLPYSPYNINIYQNESLSDGRWSSSSIIKFPVLSYVRDQTQWWNYTQKFEINNATPNSGYMIKRNGVLNQTVVANDSGYLSFYEDINKTLTISLAPLLYNVSGYVFDNYGAGIGGVLVQNGSKQNITLASGYYLIVGLQNGTYNFSYSKAGFDAGYLEVTIGGADNTSANITIYDTAPPAQVTGLMSDLPSQRTVNLSWDSIADVNYYEVFRNSTSMGHTQNTYWNDTGLAPDTSYEYVVRANDSYNNWGQNSSILNVRTYGITVISPNARETWQAGTTQTIRWHYTGNLGTYVRIELLKGGQLDSIITESTPIGENGSGFYDWSIPSTQKPAKYYKVRINSTTYPAYKDTSLGNFIISQ